MVGILAIAIYAGLGVAMVTGQVDPEEAQSLALKTAAVLGILAVAGGAVAAMMGGAAKDAGKPQ